MISSSILQAAGPGKARMPDASTLKGKDSSKQSRRGVSWAHRQAALSLMTPRTSLMTIWTCARSFSLLTCSCLYKCVQSEPQEQEVCSCLPSMQMSRDHLLILINSHTEPVKSDPISDAPFRSKVSSTASKTRTRSTKPVDLTRPGPENRQLPNTNNKNNGAKLNLINVRTVFPSAPGQSSGRVANKSTSQQSRSTKCSQYVSLVPHTKYTSLMALGDVKQSFRSFTTFYARLTFPVSVTVITEHQPKH